MSSAVVPPRTKFPPARPHPSSVVFGHAHTCGRVNLRSPTVSGSHGPRFHAGARATALPRAPVRLRARPDAPTRPRTDRRRPAGFALRGSRCVRSAPRTSNTATLSGRSPRVPRAGLRTGRPGIGVRPRRRRTSYLTAYVSCYIPCNSCSPHSNCAVPKRSAPSGKSPFSARQILDRSGTRKPL